MDPQVMEKQPGKCPICKMELTRITIEKTTDGTHTLKISDQGKQLANIQTDTVRYQNIAPETTFTGTVQIDETKTKTISARLNGRIEQLYIKAEGEKITKGQKIADLYSEDAISAQQDYLLALVKKKTNLSVGLDYDKMIEAAKTKILLWGITAKQIEELNQSSKPLKTLSIFSEAEGTVAKIMAREGDYLKEGSLILQIADLTALSVETQLYGDAANELQQQQEATITFTTSPEYHTTGKLSFISPRLQENTRVNLARFQINNPNGRILPGMMAYVAIQKENQTALAVPTAAITLPLKSSRPDKLNRSMIGSNNHPQNQSAYIWTQRPDGAYERKTIKVGKQTKTYTEVTEGLKPNDVIVSNGAYLLQSEFTFKNGNNQ